MILICIQISNANPVVGSGCIVRASTSTWLRHCVAWSPVGSARFCTQAQCGVLLQAAMESALASEGLQTDPRIEQVVKELQKRLVDHDRDIRKVVQR